MMYIIAACYFIVYLIFQAQGIQAGDSGDLVSAAATLGIAHPPGYPLYTLLGWLSTQLPFFTPAWRVTLLSSIPHTITLFFVYAIVHRITHSKIAGVFATAILFGNYIFFLYSITPEVFALLDLFIVLAVWCILEWQHTKNRIWVYRFFFLFGLSLTHHHLILFTLPAFIYFFKNNVSKKSIHWYTASLAFFGGLVPYLYIFYPPHGTSLILWNPAVNIQNVIKLITRADYGTFQSAIVYGSLPIQRVLNIQTYLQYSLIDFLWLGCMLFGFGIWYAWKKMHYVGVLLAQILFLLGPVFYFYASFPLSYRFSLGTMERFLLPSYTLFAIVLGIGYFAIIRWVSHIFDSNRLKKIIVVAISYILFLYPIKIGYATFQKTIGYSTDMTAEYVGEDILTSLPIGSILLVDRDTVLFTSEYVRYALGKRPDIILLQGFKLNFEDMRQLFHDRYPQLILPKSAGGPYIPTFLEKNKEKFRIFSYKKYDINAAYIWEPHGLVFELVEKSNMQSVDEVIAKQIGLWNAMHDPSIGILSRYNHLIMSDVKDIYTTARTEYGKYLLFANKFSESVEEFQKAIAYGGDATIAQTYMYKGISETILEHCQIALHDFQYAKANSFIPIPELSYYIGVTYRDCLKDTATSLKYFEEYKETKKTREVRLKSLE